MKYLFWQVYIIQDDRYNTMPSAFETITKTANAIAIVMATTNKPIHTYLINEMVKYKT